jgi:hypothetical protein
MGEGLDDKIINKEESFKGKDGKKYTTYEEMVEADKLFLEQMYPQKEDKFEIKENTEK